MLTRQEQTTIANNLQHHDQTLAGEDELIIASFYQQHQSTQKDQEKSEENQTLTAHSSIAQDEGFEYELHPQSNVIIATDMSEDKEWFFKRSKHIFVDHREASSLEICQLCQQQIKGPVILTYLFCGHGFHKNCLERSLKDSPNCPQCYQDFRFHVKYSDFEGYFLFNVIQLEFEVMMGENEKKGEKRGEEKKEEENWDNSANYSLLHLFDIYDL